MLVVDGGLDLLITVYKINDFFVLCRQTPPEPPYLSMLELKLYMLVKGAPGNKYYQRQRLESVQYLIYAGNFPFY